MAQPSFKELHRGGGRERTQQRGRHELPEFRKNGEKILFV